MGQTSAGVTWPVRTHIGVSDDCYDEPCISTKDVTGNFRPGNEGDVDHGWRE